MISDQLLEILRCPQDRSALHHADADQIQRINERIKSQELTNVGGERVKKQLDGGLIRESGDLLYPVIEQIAVMLPDEAIDLTSTN
ncbi:Trm112 family protein [Adhaeretor mobilis]|uniref:Trm112 family protein n=1 Tax=Adhaeretor mobilis TaxID=1930276 RepID=A0A517MXL8_9BACT|nr:hypothetical protein [Adhaeretor mobilis]QDS99628.1 hypothetical protein HG15A2_29540 [Adhaeretor mobilis]